MSFLLPSMLGVIAIPAQNFAVSIVDTEANIFARTGDDIGTIAFSSDSKKILVFSPDGWSEWLSGGFTVSIIDTEANIFARTGDDIGTIAFSSDAESLYALGLDGWSLWKKACASSSATITVSSEYDAETSTSTYKYTTSDSSGNGGLFGCIDVNRGETLTITVNGEEADIISHPLKITNFNDQGQAMGPLEGVVKTDLTEGPTEDETYSLTWTVPCDEAVDKYQYQCENHAHMRGTINVFGGCSSFEVTIMDTFSSILARTGDDIGTIAFGIDTKSLYVVGNDGWSEWLSGGFAVNIIDVEANILARTGDDVGTIAFGTDTQKLYVAGNDGWSEWLSGGFTVSIIDTSSNILARTGDDVGTIAFGTDTEKLYVAGSDGWGEWIPEPPVYTCATTSIVSQEQYSIGDEMSGYASAFNGNVTGTQYTHGWYAYNDNLFRAAGSIGQSFPSPQVITQYKMHPWAGSARSVDAKSWVFEASNDNFTTAVTLDTQDNQIFSANTWREFSVVNTSAYSQYRLRVTENNGSSTLVVQEVEFLGCDISGAI